MSQIAVRTISAAVHLAFVSSQASVSFLQTPAWGDVKNEWRHESLGWFRGDELVGAGLVLYRQLPRVRRCLAYLPEGPVLDWRSEQLPELLDVMAKHVHGHGAFGVRMGPPLRVRTWEADTVKQAITEPALRRLGDVPPDSRSDVGQRVQTVLRALGWRPQVSDAGFATGQPRFVFAIPLKGRVESDVLSGMNQLWRRNIKKAAKAGVVVSRGSIGDLASFHQLYAETARRDHFTPRPLSYFQRMFTAMQGESHDRIRLYSAHHAGDLVAATIWVRVGDHVWYSYGASATAKRDIRGSNAVQWQMIRDAIAIGADTYDLRGITDTLDPEDPHLGLLQFKVGTGGEAVEYVGEWDLPLNRLIYKAFDAYMSRR
ncbi:MAG: lipid II:glycine glycyltransferase FemX [Nocardioidaceae bacterium]